MAVEATAMVWRVEIASWLDNGGDVSWRLSGTAPDGQVRQVRAGVREAVREQIVRATRRRVAGDWSSALITFAAAAAEMAPAEATVAWVAPGNFAAVRRLVADRRLADRPLVDDAFVHL
jgi:hypothetical protein